MARLARVVVPGLPHHITQRGNGGGRVFFSDEDYALYVRLLSSHCREAKVTCWTFCLMPNHIHAILVPSDEDGLRKALAATHRAYAGALNARRRKTGHFWQGRYGCAVMDETHLTAAFRYILRNPVTAKLAEKPEQWRWSSARGYLKGSDDGLTDKGPMLGRFPGMKALLGDEEPELDEHIILREDETIGRPRGDAAFIEKLERKLGRSLKAGKRGPKPRTKAAGKAGKTARKARKVN
jgi:putative transposase